MTVAPVEWLLEMGMGMRPLGGLMINLKCTYKETGRRIGPPGFLLRLIYIPPPPLLAIISGLIIPKIMAMWAIIRKTVSQIKCSFIFSSGLLFLPIQLRSSNAIAPKGMTASRYDQTAMKSTAVRHLMPGSAVNNSGKKTTNVK